jgi:uncharacterized protein (DUF488 family)
MAEPGIASITVYSIGHGNRGNSDFFALLDAVGITCLIDVRAYPASKRHPQFTRLALEPALRAAGMQYVWEGPALGGMRAPRAASLHTALTDPTLRGFADHMADSDFTDAIARLLQLAARETAAIMCAEREPLYCHRSFIADALLLHGAQVLHIHDAGDIRRHALRPEARCLANAEIVYDGGVQLGLTL